MLLWIKWTRRTNCPTSQLTSDMIPRRSRSGLDSNSAWARQRNLCLFQHVVRAKVRFILDPISSNKIHPSHSLLSFSSYFIILILILILVLIPIPTCSANHHPPVPIPIQSNPTPTPIQSQSQSQSTQKKSPPLPETT